MEPISKLFQFPAQFQVIVDLAVEDDYGPAVRGFYGLVSALNVDDLQRTAPSGAISDSKRRPLLVGTAMNDSGEAATDAARSCGAASVRKAEQCPIQQFQPSDQYPGQVRRKIWSPPRSRRTGLAGGPITRISPLHLRQKQRSINAILVPDRYVHQRVEQRIGEVMRLR